MIEIQDFVAHAPVSQETIDRFRGQVPDDLVDIWQRYGFGTFGQGFFKVVDPDVHLAEIGDLIGHVDDDGSELPSIPIIVTGLADLICWEPGDVGLSALLFRNRAATGLGDVDTMFVILDYDGMEAYGSRDLDWDMYPKAVEAHGPSPTTRSSSSSHPSPSAARRRSSACASGRRSPPSGPTSSSRAPSSTDRGSG